MRCRGCVSPDVWSRLVDYEVCCVGNMHIRTSKFQPRCVFSEKSVVSLESWCAGNYLCIEAVIILTCVQYFTSAKPDNEQYKAAKYMRNHFAASCRHMQRGRRYEARKSRFPKQCNERILSVLHNKYRRHSCQLTLRTPTSYGWHHLGLKDRSNVNRNYKKCDSYLCKAIGLEPVHLTVDVCCRSSVVTHGTTLLY